MSPAGVAAVDELLLAQRDQRQLLLDHAHALERTRRTERPAVAVGALVLRRRHGVGLGRVLARVAPVDLRLRVQRQPQLRRRDGLDVILLGEAAALLRDELLEREVGPLVGAVVRGVPAAALLEETQVGREDAGAGLPAAQHAAA